MLKLQLLLRQPARTPVGAFAAAAAEVAAALLAHAPAALKLTATTREPPRLAVVPFRRDRVALYSIWDPDAAGAPAWVARAQAAHPGPWAGYRVAESLPRRYARDWPDGAATPGVGLLTLLRRRRGLPDAEFLRRWHEGHSTLSLRVHPMWCYVRNVVEAAVVAAAPPWDGIVEEQFREPRDLLAPWRLFGGPAAMLPNMARVAVDLAGFLDLATLAPYLTTERWLRSAPGCG